MHKSYPHFKTGGIIYCHLKCAGNKRCLENENEDNFTTKLQFRCVRTRFTKYCVYVSSSSLRFYCNSQTNKCY